MDESGVLDSRAELKRLGRMAGDVGRGADVEGKVMGATAGAGT
jgi:hypothetical protein